MFQKSIEAIIAQGVKDLEAVVKQTRQAADDAKIRVSQCQSEIQSLVNLAKQVPEKVFDRYSNVLVGTVNQYGESPTGLYASIRLSTSEAQLQGLMGSEDLKRGKYRVIVLLEQIS
jgi:hypothetical protein